jgi:Fe-Mn family superoxide dismutase
MFNLKKLPYEYNDLEPVISKNLLEIHYSRHHQTYCDNFNKAVEENKLEEKSLDEIFSQISKFPKGLENNGGGFFNHEFF